MLEAMQRQDSPLTSRSRRARSTDARLSRRVGLVVSIASAVLGLALLAVGLYAWQVPPPAERSFTVGERVAMPATGWFGKDMSVYAPVPKEGDPPAPTAYSCSLTGPDGVRSVATDPDRATAGSRVKDGSQYVPVVVVGDTADGETLRCLRSPGAQTDTLWLFPTNLSPSRTPLAFLVGGLLALGLAALVNPRTRSI